MKRCHSAAIIFLLLCSFTFQVFAESLDDKLSDIQNKMETEKGKAAQAQNEINNVSEELRLLQEQVDLATNEYRQVKTQLDDTEQKIKENKATLEKAEKNLKKQMKILNKRIRDIYKNGQISYVDVLFGANDFHDFLTRMDLLRRIIKHDYDLIMKIKEERELIMDKQAELEKFKAEIEVLEKDARAKKEAVDKSKQQKQSVLDKVKNDKALAERAYQELLEASKEVQQMIRQSHYNVTGGQGSGHSTGTMIWPLSGPITSEFGWRTHPIYGNARFHSGIDIGGDYGQSILAADGGVVIYAGWISGYGNSVIIDHGGGVSSLYAHCQSLTVGEGQSVSQGQLIAYCGSTGNSTGPHTHFEVRQGGEPVSPYGFLR